MATPLTDGKKTQIAHNVQQIFQYFKNPSPDSCEFAEQLQRSVGPFIPYQPMIHTSKVRLCEDNPVNKKFLRKYDELKLRNTKEVDPLVMLLAKIKESPEVMSSLTTLCEQENRQSGSVTPSTVDTFEERVAASGRPRALFTKNLDFKEMRSEIEKNMESDHIFTPGEPLPHGVKYYHRAKSSVASDLPWQPDWLFTRPYQGFDYVLEDYEITPPMPNLENLPPLAQESVLIHDLIYLLHGEEGVYIKPLPLPSPLDDRTFHIDACFQGSLRELACDILNICSAYSTVARFMHEKTAFEYGAVNQALAAAIRQLTRDYEVLLCQLEQQHRLGQLKCAHLEYYLREPGLLLRALADLCKAINVGQCIGGKVLSVLYDKCRSLTGEVKLFEIFCYLIKSATVPYFEQLQRWIYRGIVADPFKEFFIVESDSKLKCKDTVNREYINKFWDYHYTINKSQIPNFLEVHAQKILKTGKYLNVIQQCGNEWEFPRTEAIHFAMNDPRYVDQIDRAYLHASKMVLELMIREYRLKEHLLSVKHFFLLDRGDFVVHFMDVAEKELCKPSRVAKISRLDSLLEIALRTSTANVDPNKDSIQVVLLPYDLISHISTLVKIRGASAGASGGKEESSVTDMNLSALEAFSLDYDVDWPVSLVLNRQVMDRYQLLFRQLFYCKHVERLLGRVWIIQQTAKQRPLKSVSWLVTSYALRARMLAFVQNLVYYMTFEVIEPKWCQFMEKFREAKNLDDILDLHSAFLQSCLQDCMLEDHALLKVVHKLLTLCVQFSNFNQQMSRSSDISAAGASTSIILDDFGGGMDTSVLPSEMESSMYKGGSSFETTVETFDQNFTRIIRELLSLIVANSERHLSVANLLLRLNFNDFYSGNMSHQQQGNIPPSNSSRTLTNQQGYTIEDV